jgi:HSP20 family protein
MALVRWDPIREIDSLQGEMNRLFSTFFDTPTSRGGGNGASTARRWIPAMDLIETDEHFVLKADLPGMDEGDVNIEVENNILTVSGERKAAHEEKHEGYYRLERATGAFSRSLTLPEGIDADSVTATFNNGVLEVRVPKPVQAKPRRVQISLGGGEPKTIEADPADAAKAADPAAA